ncbi:single-stranded DNA-binding protein [Cardinium endosymbiont of Oedothorax gibbosus]|uniref:single-stranded DNA-binding protein n=1 Tax=Cardinium endosymbiont of Oedothorax gibbosus TaxID=931101 RepID=UPI002024E951|nr:single-stranded DNA-binding protein [Cardinium endosymbiont of Oedothorax gibbosus]CAH2560075.1 Single-stranded DNA-binding protein [Cardinium endosymbiont of Oedothorax gibbosus]
MGSVNKVIILGNLGKDPAVHHLENGRMRVHLTVATHDAYKTKEGEKINHTDWHEVVLWTPHAEIAAQYLSKGGQVYIEGKLNHRFYIDKDGQQKHTIQIVGQHVVLLSGGKTKNEGVHVINHTPQNRPHEKDDINELPL